MKYLFFIVVSAGLAACTITDKKETPQQKEERGKRDAEAMRDSANYTTIQWIDSVAQNLGEIKEGDVVEIGWKFRNTGSHPLIIEDVSASCGCTLASKPNEPIAPGAEGEIKAKFDSHDRPGHANKSLTVYANIKNHNNGKDTQLSFSADVKE